MIKVLQDTGRMTDPTDVTNFANNIDMEIKRTCTIIDNSLAMKNRNITAVNPNVEKTVTADTSGKELARKKSVTSTPNH